MQICIVMTRSLRHCPLSRPITSWLHSTVAAHQGSEFPKFPTNRRTRDRTFARHIRARRIATTMHRSAAVRPAGSTRGCFSSCLARTPGCFIRDYETRLTLAGVLHLPTRVTEVRSVGTAAWRAQKQLLHGTVADDELERLRPARFVPKARSNRADLMSLVPPEAGCQGAVHNRAAVAAGRGRRCRPAKATAAGRRLYRRP
jgi:hypothetical protein